MAVTPWVGRVHPLPRQPGLVEGLGGSGAAREAAGSVLWLGGGMWRLLLSALAHQELGLSFLLPAASPI